MWQANPFQDFRFRQLMLTTFMVLVGTVATEIVIAEPTQVTMPLLLRCLVGFGICAAMAYHQGRLTLSQTDGQQDSRLSLFGLIAMISPMVVEPVWRLLTETGHPFEIQLLIGFRNVSLVSLYWSRLPRTERLTLMISLFTILFCISSSQDSSLLILGSAYLLAGLIWLSLTYWSELKTDRVVGERQQTPWRIYGLFIAMVVCGIGFVSLPESVRLRMTEGFLPSSGGTGEADPFARSGIGDGDAFVAATQNALSFAPIDEAPFVEGSEPSLYDVFQDTYGVPKPPKNQQRSIALPPELMKKNHEKMAKAKQASRQFSVNRQPPESAQHRHAKSTESDAILHLLGRVPAHLRVETFDLFDGENWYPTTRSEKHMRAIELRMIQEKPWITVPGYLGENEAWQFESHSLRLLNVKTNRILSPANMVGLHIDRCDRTDMFMWAQEDVLMMERKTLPSLCELHVQSRTVDPQLLFKRQSFLRSGPQNFRELPEGELVDRIQELAKSITTDVKTDWGKTQAILAYLKTNYQLDRSHVSADEQTHPLEDFLFASKVGPDYLFASAAACMIRSLGISCRVVKGFYAAPESYDPATRQTSVYPEDAHWWVELYGGGYTWVTADPSPGYEVLLPEKTVLQIAWSVMMTSFSAMVLYWPLSIAAAIGCCMCWVYRIHLKAWLIGWKWWLSARWIGHANSRDLVLATIRSANQKYQLIHRSGCTPVALGQLLEPALTEKQHDSEQGSNSKLQHLFEQALYGPPEQFHHSEQHVLYADCRDVLNAIQVRSSCSPSKTDPQTSESGHKI